VLWPSGGEIRQVRNGFQQIRYQRRNRVADAKERFRRSSPAELSRRVSGFSELIATHGAGESKFGSTSVVHSKFGTRSAENADVVTNDARAMDVVTNFRSARGPSRDG